jgi:hypothetical protein
MEAVERDTEARGPQTTCSSKGDDLEENEVALGLTSSGGVSGGGTRCKDSRAGNPPIEENMPLFFSKKTVAVKMACPGKPEKFKRKKSA